MKVLLLAAGRSKRLKPIQDKNLLFFLGKPLIQHQIEQLFAAGLKDLIVVGGNHNLPILRKLIRGISAGIKVIEQKDLDEGMAGAVLASKKWLGKEPVFVMSANDVVESSAFKQMLSAMKDQKFDSFLLAKKVQKYFPGGYLKTSGGKITGIVEKPGEGKEPGKLVNLVLHLHKDSQRLLEALEQTKSARDDRYEAALDRMIKGGMRMKAVPYEGYWQPVKYPWHVISLMNYFLEKAARLPASRPPKVSADTPQIAKSATIHGDVNLAKGVRILDNAVIVGPAYIGENTIIATNAMVRGSHIGANCVIGFGSEVTRSYIGDGVWTHTNYVGDSIIGNNCSFGAGTVTGNLRLDEGTIKVGINGGDKIDSGMNKLGLIMGDNVRCGINTSFMPGVKIGNNSFIGAGIVVAVDVEDNKFVYGKTELVVKDNTAKPDMKKRQAMQKKMR